MLLSPSSLEDDFSGMRVINPKDLLSLLKNEPSSLSKTPLPHDIAPSYSLRDLTLLSANGNTPGFKLSARKSSTYQKEELSHLREVIVELKDGTRIESQEAIHDFKKGEIVFLGTVQIHLPGGADLFTEQVIFYSKPMTRILVPRNEALRGIQHQGKTTLQFTARGLEYIDQEPKALKLLSEVRVNLRGEKGAEIRSDFAEYSDALGQLRFGMRDNQPIQKQFVEVHEPDLDLKSRTLELDISNQKELETITARTDVWFKDTHDQARPSVGTGGMGVYAVEKNQIILSDFPQLYQDNDTITGDTIIFHRDSDTVEVKQSNAIYNN